MVLIRLYLLRIKQISYSQLSKTRKLELTFFSKTHFKNIIMPKLKVFHNVILIMNVHAASGIRRLSAIFLLVCAVKNMHACHLHNKGFSWRVYGTKLEFINSNIKLHYHFILRILLKTPFKSSMSVSLKQPLTA